MKFLLEQIPNRGKCGPLPPARRGPRPDPKLVTIINNAYYRFKNTPSYVLTQRWSVGSGKQRFLDYALELAAVEYRPGFVVGIALRDIEARLVNEDTLMWYPSNLGKLLNVRCNKRDETLPFGVGKDGNQFTCRLLDGDTFRFDSAGIAHGVFIADRIKYFRSLLPDMAPRPQAALERLIWRALKELSENKSVTKF